MGYAVMGTATAAGERRTMEAAQRAIASPLLEAGAIDGARGILINITGSSSLKLAEVQQACTIIQGAAHEDANIIFGAVLDEKMKDAVKITVIATGFKESARQRRNESFEPVIVPRHRDHFHASEPEPIMMEPEPEPRFEPDPKPTMIMQEGVERVPVVVAPSADVISLDTMRTPPPGYQPEDLDVPAFLRKRLEL